MVLAGYGTRVAALAAIGVLVAHALSKCALFLAVGVIDHTTHTRDLRELSGLGRVAPALAIATGAAAASYAAVPPMLGFVGKEAGLEAFWEPAHEGDVGAALVLALLVLASCFTVAYTLRFWWGAFAPREGVPDVPDEAAPALSFVMPTVVLSALGLGLGLLPSLVHPLAAAYADGAYGVGEGKPYELELWHGLEPVLGFSVVTLVVGVLLFRGRELVHRLQHAAPTGGDADRAYRGLLHGVDVGAGRLTGVVQSGSLPVYLATILLTTVAVVLPYLLLADVGPLRVRGFDDPLQPVVAVAVAVLAVLTARARRRFTAVLLVGGVGYGVALLFVLQGAPDLALTQFLVETLSVVVFVLVLRRLPIRFSRRPLPASQAFRAFVGGSIGVLVAAFALVAGAGRRQESIADQFVVATPEAGGKNIVNVILVDFRAFDTLGEIAVLVLAAVGIGALVVAARDERHPDEDEATHRRRTARTRARAAVGAGAGEGTP